MQMKKEQRILTIIIVLAIWGIAILSGTMVYEEKIARNKETVEAIKVPVIEEDIVEEDDEDEEEKNEEDLLEQNKEVYVGEEEKEEQKEETIMQNDNEKAIDLVKKEWGESDGVSFSIEEKKDAKYYVAVKQNSLVIAWYEVNTEDWSISEY